MNRRNLLLGASAALAACATGRAQSSLPLSEELDATVERSMARIAVVPGLTVAVYSSEGVYARGFGVTDIGTGESADADTAFYIASSTKPLTSLALLRRAERGELDLDQPIGAFAPHAPFPPDVRANEVTFRHLLSHQSGISNDPISFRVAFTGQHTPDLLWRLLGASTVNTDAPFGRFEYTNSGYNIATVLTDRHFGAPWQDTLHNEVFAPAGMTHTSARMSLAASGGWRVAKPHASLPEGVQRLYLEKVDMTMQSAGGVITSANDAAKWLELMIEGGTVGGRRVLSERSIEATRAPLAQTAEGTEFAGYSREAYGLGWYSGLYRDEVLYHHFGGFSGTRAHVSYIPARRIGVAVFANDSSVGGRFSDIVANFVYDRTAGRADATSTFDAKLDELVARRDQLHERIRVDRASRASRVWTLTRARSTYAGAYENERLGRIDVAPDGEGFDVRFGVLRSRAEPFTQPDSIRVELVPLSGEPIAFEGPSAAPTILRYDGDVYTRV
jgi:CubicO group peptidase (beta-lactamase class C family)